MGGLRKTKMKSDGHKAMRNSFAHHRAILLFARPDVETVEPRKAARPYLFGQRPTLARNWKVADGIHGFTSSTSTAAFA